MSNVEIFRRKLQRLREMEEVFIISNDFSVIIDSLIEDFNELFPQQIFTNYNNKEDLLSLIDKYCFRDPDKCPICGSLMKLRTPRRTRRNYRDDYTFLGCSKFPKCKGTRKTSGDIVISEALRLFLAEKVFNESSKRESNNLKRFREIEI